MVGSLTGRQNSLSAVANYLLKPFDYPGQLQNGIFETPFHFLRDALMDRGISLRTYDMGSFGDADKVLFFNHNDSVLEACLAEGLGRDSMVLFLYEPSVVFPRQYARKVWDSYGKVFTFKRELADSYKFIMMRYPQGQKTFPRVPSYGERKLLTLINANKYSYVHNELYSLRRLAIRYFERNEPQFDLYGYDWDHNPFLSPGWKSLLLQAAMYRRIGRFVADFVSNVRGFGSFRGTVVQKLDCLSNYRFCICFENEAFDVGLTEKIFDCLFAGTVPIYFGAPSISKYVPQESFIDFGSFEDYGDLHEHLLQMGNNEFQRMQSTGQEFINSIEFESWKPESVFNEIAASL